MSCERNYKKSNDRVDLHSQRIMKGVKAVGCAAGAKGTAKIKSMLVQNPSGQARGDSNGPLLAM